MKQCVLIASMIALVVGGGGRPAFAQSTMRGRRTFVLRRVNSTWKIVHLHASIVTQ